MDYRLRSQSVECNGNAFKRVVSVVLPDPIFPATAKCIVKK